MSAGLESTAARCTALAAGVDHVLLAGMGGSSLFPEVVARSGATDPGAPALHVLDTTDPAAIARLGRELPPDRTLHVAASKSGSTLETRSHLAWAWERHPDPARFAAITDPGSDLAALAADRGSPPPSRTRPTSAAATRPCRTSASSRRCWPGPTSPGCSARPPAWPTGCGRRRPPTRRPAWPPRWPRACAGRDKLTIVVPEGQATFGLWLEQLLAESTGKDGTGVVPVVGEPLAGPEVYGDDRLFVALGDDTAGRAVGVGRRRPPGGRAAVRRRVRGPGGAGAAVGDGHRAGGRAARHPALRPARRRGGQGGHGQGAGRGPPTSRRRRSTTSSARSVRATTSPSRPSSTPARPWSTRSSGPGWRCATACRVATTVGLGPRFLHSTGQLHKGARTPASSSRWWPTTGTTTWPSPVRRTASPRSSGHRPTATCSRSTTASGGPAAVRLADLVEVAS